MLYSTAILSDPWLGGRERFRLRGVILSKSQANALRLAAERVAYLHHELAEIVWAQPRLLDDFFCLTPYQKAMWLASEASWHGIARVDLFICRDGCIRACEMNSDTPSGEAEAIILNQLLHPFHPDTIDPNREFDEDFWQMVCASYVSREPNTKPQTIAIIYPTDLPEDLSMIAIYRTWFEKRGCRVILGSPFNLRVDREGKIRVLNVVVDLIIRHYKTDWWAERETIWQGQAPFPDPYPLDAQLLPLLEAERRREVTVVNPFGAVLTQNKKALALMWERKDLFSREAQLWIEAYIPETRRFISAEAVDLKQEEWVLKSVYGCEGDSVICGPFVKSRDWQVALRKIEGRHWVAQRFFEVEPTLDGLLPNYGVYVMGGRAAGFYTRLSAQSTDYTAIAAPTFLAFD